VTSGESGIVCAELSQTVLDCSPTSCPVDGTQQPRLLGLTCILGIPRVVPLALVEVVVAVALLVIVALREHHSPRPPG
jgi:hypothetical protein